MIKMFWAGTRQAGAYRFPLSFEQYGECMRNGARYRRSIDDHGEGDVAQHRRGSLKKKGLDVAVRA